MNTPKKSCLSTLLDGEFSAVLLNLDQFSLTHEEFELYIDSINSLSQSNIRHATLIMFSFSLENTISYGADAKSSFLFPAIFNLNILAGLIKFKLHHLIPNVFVFLSQKHPIHFHYYRPDQIEYLHHISNKFSEDDYKLFFSYSLQSLTIFYSLFKDNENDAITHSHKIYFVSTLIYIFSLPQPFIKIEEHPIFEYFSTLPEEYHDIVYHRFIIHYSNVLQNRNTNSLNSTINELGVSPNEPYHIKTISHFCSFPFVCSMAFKEGFVPLLEYCDVSSHMASNPELFF